MRIQLQFHGAARTVTGAMFVLDLAGQRLLLECGLFQGPRQEARERNRTLPFDARALHNCVLTHAHLDHSGNLPNLARLGFRGQVHATRASVDLCHYLLPDSAHIQEKDAEYLNQKASRAGQPPIEPLYTMADAREALARLVGRPYHDRFLVADGVWCTFLDAGHILGSAQVLLEVGQNGATKRFLFSGDLGPYAMPILRDPEAVPGPVDALIIESTYGNRLHGPLEDQLERLWRVLHETYERGGRVVIPAFSVDRTQRLVYFLNRLEEAGRLPRVPVFVDSPLSVNATQVYRAHPECYDEETARFLAERKDPFGFHRLHYITDAAESKKLNDLREPCVIISASGMCEAGRILHHLKHAITDPRNAIVIVGYQAEQTLGWRLVHQAQEVRIYGELYPVRARVEVLNALSAHADREGLLRHLREHLPGKPRQTFVIHGEEDQALAFAGHLKERLGYENVAVPRQGEKFEIL